MQYVTTFELKSNPNISSLQWYVTDQLKKQLINGTLDELSCVLVCFAWAMKEATQTVN